LHLKEQHPYSPALMKFYDKRHFKFGNNNFTNMLLSCNWVCFKCNDDFYSRTKQIRYLFKEGDIGRE
jgi:hypothetical protein